MHKSKRFCILGTALFQLSHSHMQVQNENTCEFSKRCFHHFFIFSKHSLHYIFSLVSTKRFSRSADVPCCFLFNPRENGRFIQFSWSQHWKHLDAVMRVHSHTAERRTSFKNSRRELRKNQWEEPSQNTLELSITDAEWQLRCYGKINNVPLFQKTLGS